MACTRIFNKSRLISTQTARILSPFGVQKLHASSDSKLTDVTHTGQVWDAKDYRNVRFSNADRIVNKSHAIDLIHEVPVTECTERVVACNGGGGPLGHPKVYINLDKPGVHDCLYCGLRFTKKDGHH